MDLGNALIEEVLADGTPIVVVVALIGALVGAVAGRQRRGFKATGAFVALHLVLVVTAASLLSSGVVEHRHVRFAARMFGALSVTGAVASVVFGVALPRVRVVVPRLLQDLAVAAVALVVIGVLADDAGYAVGSLFATSAVLTAVLGFALQDTLGNVIGGLALQTDESLQVGDWVKVGDNVGRVVEMRWRCTAIETRNGETLLVPNSHLMKTAVMVLGRRQAGPVQWRRWVYFNVDFRQAPPDVVDVVMAALRSAPLERVAADPAPDCIFMEQKDSWARYAVRYWLTDLQVDDPTDAMVRTRIFFALRRAGIPLSIPAAALFVTQESSDREVMKDQKEQTTRVAALDRVELFATLPDAEQARLARSLNFAPFAKGEVVTRQGDEAHWLYLLVEGEVSVRMSAPGGLEREVSRLRAGAFFGEMALITGDRRTASVVAMTDVECFRLDKASFQQLVREHPELAEPFAAIIAKREVELQAARDALTEAAGKRRVDEDKSQLVAKIRGFFGSG